MKSKLKPLLLSAVLLVSALLAVLYYTRSSQRVSAPFTYSGPKEKITIANIGEFTILNVIAKEKGYFDIYGLEATITEYDAGPASIQALLTGKADIAMASDFVGVINIFKDPTIRIIAEASSHQVFNVVIRKDRGISQPSDLRKKRIGVTKKSVGEYYLGRFLSLNGLSDKDITAVDMPPAQLTAALETGTVDAIFIFDPYAFNLKSKLGDRVDVWPAQGEKYTYDLFYTRETFIREHPETIRRYLQAISESQKLVSRNPAEAKDIVRESLGYTEEYTEQVWKNHDFKIGLDQDLLLSMEDQAKFAIERKLTESKDIPNYLDYIYFDGLEKIEPDSISIIH